MNTIPKLTKGHLAKHGLGANATQHDRLVRQSQQLVSQTFFGTLLKQMRDSPFKSELFDGGKGGKAFGEMLDQHLAERMASGTGRRLVEAMVKRIESRMGSAKQSAQDQKALRSRPARAAYGMPTRAPARDGGKNSAARASAQPANQWPGGDESEFDQPQWA